MACCGTPGTGNSDSRRAGTMKPTSLTLARRGRQAYQVTYWDDGVARWDGAETKRLGAWQALIPRDWFRRAAPFAHLLRSPTPARPSETTIVIDGPDGRITYSASDGHESDSFWIFAAILDGMATTTLWAPLDTVGTRDLSGWASSARMTLTQRSCSAAALRVLRDWSCWQARAPRLLRQRHLRRLIWSSERNLKRTGSSNSVRIVSF